MLDAGMHVLLLTSDGSLASTVTDLSRELGLTAQTSKQFHEVQDDLNCAKFEGVLVDLDTVDDARSVLSAVRASRSNKNSVVFVIATDYGEALNALNDRAHFVLRRPVDRIAMRRTLHAAYDLMRKERRRYFRCPIDLPVELTTEDGESHRCSTINVSSSGAALNVRKSLELGQRVELTLLLPDGPAVRTNGAVIWDDKHGKCGVHFRCSPQMQAMLDSWLDSNLTPKADPR